MSVATTKERMASLDILRFGAAVAVMLYHFTFRVDGASAESVSALESVTRYGYLGVDLFFMISGFVVLWSARGRTAARFVRSRMLRLYPEFWIAVLVSALIFTMTPGGFGGGIGPREVAINLTMIPQHLGTSYVDSVYWTLGAELKFYALIWLALVLRQLDRAEGLLLGWVALSVVATLVDVGGLVRSLIIFPYGALFAAGGLFFLVYDSGWTWVRVSALVLACLASVSAAIGGIAAFAEGAPVDTRVSLVTGTLLVGFFLTFGLLIRLRWTPTRPRLVALAGALTYPLYLLHNTGKELFIHSGLGWHPAIAVVVAIVFAMTLSYVVLQLASRTVLPVFTRILDAGFRLLGLARERPRTASST